MGRPPATVLVVDDEKNIRRTLRLVLEGEGYVTLEAETAEAALERLQKPTVPVDVVLLDVKLPGMSGLAALQKIVAEDEPPACVVMSGHASPAEAAEAIKLGALDFVEKPLVRERVLVALNHALLALRSRRLLDVARRESRLEMVGESAPMQKLYRDVEKVAGTKASVLITGESGTGKELVSRAIHRASPREGGPFVKINCAAIPRDLIESELFGHEKGAFTGAIARKRGLFEQAHGGTLFLDEVGDMDLLAQAKLLRVLQSGEISRIGSEHTMMVDVRVIAATNREIALQTGTFREDLFFRLAVFPIRMPALRERKEDVPLLAHSFFARFWKENGLRPKPIDRAVFERLSTYAWPGNVRELRNVVERMAILSEERVTSADLPDDPHASPFVDDPVKPSADDLGASEHPLDLDEAPLSTDSESPLLGPVASLREVRDRAERAYLVELLRHTSWNITKTAVLLGIERTNLHRKIRGHGIRRGE